MSDVPDTHAPERVARFEPQVHSIGAARAFTRDVLEQWHLRDLVERASLVVDELVANAVMRSRTEAEVRFVLAGAHLRIEVRDGSMLPVRPQTADPASLSGRGLQFVEQLATRWGVEYFDDAKSVWVELERPGGTPPSGGDPIRREQTAGSSEQP